MAASFFTELKKRNVFKVGVAYLILAWVVVKITDTAVPALHLPEWVNSLVFLLGAIGLPFALFFAWAFEVTPEGIKKESEITSDESIAAHTGEKLNYIIIGLLVVALGYFINKSSDVSGPTETTVTEESLTKIESPKEAVQKSEGTSIAVLPFVNMSSDPEQEYFSDGISEEILNVLAKIPDLHITSRSSAFSYKGKDINIAEVAKVLGVKNVLEGSVRKSGTKVRITAQLINAESDKHLWSETYDRELTDIFKIQDEISAAIVDALKEKLGIELVKTTSTARAINPEAYDLYLQGLNGLHISSFDSSEKAVKDFEAAIKIAPNFLMARIKLAYTLVWQIVTGSRFDREILDKADAIIEEVLTINPESADAYYVRSYIAGTKGLSDLENKYVREAFRLNPNDAIIITKHVVNNGGDIGEEKAKVLFNRAKQIDPLNADIPYSYAWYLVFILQEYLEAEKAYKQAAKINSQNGNISFDLSRFYSRFFGNLIDAVKQMDLTHKGDINDPDSPRYLSMYYLSLGDAQKALEYADRANVLNIHNADAIDVQVNALIYRGQVDKALKLVKDSLDNPDTVYRRISKIRFTSRAIYLLLKSNKLAEAEGLINQHFPEISNLIDAPLPKSVNEIENSLGISLLTITYQAQGKIDKAQKLAERLNLLDEDFYSKGQVRLMGLEYLYLARISAVQNNNDKTVTYLEAAIDNGYLVNWRTELLQSPYFLSLHKHPRFIALVKRLEIEMVRQRAILEKDLAAE